MTSLSETFEAKQLVLWLDANGYEGRFWHVPNEGQILSPLKWPIIGRLRAMGLRKGIADYTIILKNGRALFLELKKTKGGVRSPSQEQHIAMLQSAGQLACFCAGYLEAIRVIQEYEKC